MQGLYRYHAPILTLILYISITLIALPLIYVFFMTDGKRVVNYYAAGKLK